MCTWDTMYFVVFQTFRVSTTTISSVLNVRCVLVFFNILFKTPNLIFVCNLKSMQNFRRKKISPENSVHYPPLQRLKAAHLLRSGQCICILRLLVRVKTTWEINIHGIHTVYARNYNCITIFLFQKCQ